MEWKPLTPVQPGELRPCGENPDGSHLEVWANPDDVPSLLAEGLTLVDRTLRRRYSAHLSSTPYYANGDVQIVLKEVA